MAVKIASRLPRIIIIVKILSYIIGGSSPPSIAQILSDGTHASRVTSADNQNFLIEAGDRAGNNLFHSFDQFSVPTNGSVVFKNATEVANIFSRVTGANMSNIDGLIQANGRANLFLLNPNGIIFGPNARLDIGGSFLGSTADTLLFDENKAFSTIDTVPSQLLSVNIPKGLQWNRANPAPIASRSNTLTVSESKALTLLGGDLNLNASTLSTLGGRIVLGSLGAAGTVQLSGAQSVDFPNRLTRGDVILENTSLLRAESGHIDVIANVLSLTDGSRLETVTHSPRVGGDITVNASNAINIVGFSADGLFSGILSSSATATSGTGGNITLNSPQNTLTLADRGFIGTLTQSQNAGGNVEVNVNRLNLNSGGQIVTLTTDRGDGGTITLNAKEEITISGASDDFIDHPFLTLSTFDLNRLDFTTEANPNVSESGPGGIPYISVERTPTEIISGSTLLGESNGQVEYYSFGVIEGDSRAIFDIDFGDGDTKIFLFSQSTGELIAENNNGLIDNSAEVSEGDPFLDITLSEPGFYILGVADGFASAVSQELIDTKNIRSSDYTLQASIENQGTAEIALARPNPNNSRNPNVTNISGSFSESSGLGKGGHLIIKTGQLTANNDAKLATMTSGQGLGGGITLNVERHALLTGAEVQTVSQGRRDGGNILMDTGNLSLFGSEIKTQTFSTGNAGDIYVRAKDSIQLNRISETSEERQARGAISSNNGPLEAPGSGGKIEIETTILSLKNGSKIGTTGEQGKASGGKDLKITAVESIVVDRSFLELVNPSSNPAGGNIAINTKKLQVLDGLIAQVSGGGASNSLLISAQDSIDIIGANSIIVLGPQRGSNNGSGLILKTRDLRIADGATVGLSDLQLRNSEISATISIEAKSVTLSNQARLLSEPFAPTAQNGSSGTLTVTAAENISVVGDSRISVSSSVSGGDAGNLTLSAKGLLIDEGGLISAESTGGDQGNILLNLNESLTIRRGGAISTNAKDTSTGGDITINSPIIFTLPNENSDIIANAIQGDGGNINITSQSVLGFEFTNSLDPRNNSISEISASSQLGVDGQLTIINPQRDPSESIKLSEAFLEATALISDSCSTGEGSFVVAGQGGLPSQPADLTTRDQPWADIRDLSTFREQPSPTVPPSNSSFPKQLVEASAWQTNSANQVEIVAYSKHPPNCQKTQNQ